MIALVSRGRSDPLMTNPHGLSVFQPAVDLPRTPMLAQQSIDPVPGLFPNAPADFALSPSYGEAVGLLRVIPRQTLISSHFAADRRGMDSDYPQRSSRKDAPFSPKPESDSVAPGSAVCKLSPVFLLLVGDRSPGSTATGLFN